MKATKTHVGTRSTILELRNLFIGHAKDILQQRAHEVDKTLPLGSPSNSAPPTETYELE